MAENLSGPAAPVTFSSATENLASSLDAIQTSLGQQIDHLANDINELATKTSSDGDITSVKDLNTVKDGDVVRLQYAINTMEKSAETGASTFTKAQGISKQVVRTLAGA